MQEMIMTYTCYASHGSATFSGTEYKEKSLDGQWSDISTGSWQHLLMG
jgi:hypothetical protein